MVDCLDSTCIGNSVCYVAIPEICGNGLDDDGDGLVDCADANCVVVDPACGVVGGVDEFVEEEVEEIEISPYAEIMKTRIRPSGILGANCPDKDGDGFPFASRLCKTGPYDCEDDNSNIYPGAVEVCDGFDNDCDDNRDNNLMGLGCLPNLYGAYVVQEPKDFYEKMVKKFTGFLTFPSTPVIEKIIYNGNTKEFAIFGKGFYEHGGESEKKMVLLIGFVDENGYYNAYPYEFNFVNENYVNIFFEGLPEGQSVWVQAVNYVERRGGKSTLGNVYRFDGFIRAAREQLPEDILKIIGM